ncbi:MAG: Ig-like domain-containing protein, partial [Eubacterium sp.]|nr:Ig-like domain-containing protein [Candidatus Colimonas fimequi]
DKRITVGSLEDAVILIKNVTNPDKLFVTIGAETLTPEDCGNNTYKVVIKHLNKDATLFIEDALVAHITSADELAAYRLSLAEGNTDVDAILESDITADENTFVKLSKNIVLSGEFDGNGHTITCPEMNERPRNLQFNPLFDEISPDGTVKNLKISGGKLTYSIDDDDQALITRTNNGKIDSCAFTDIRVDIHNIDAYYREGFATAAFYNYGEITNCFVKNVTIDNLELNNVGGLVVENNPENTEKAAIRNCVVSNFCNGNAVMDNGIVVRRGKAEISNCYYDIGGTDATGNGNGENIWIGSKRIPGIELAYKLNAADSEPAWGVADANDENPLPLHAYTDGKAPIQIKFKNYLNEYTISDTVTIPTQEDSGAKAWANGDTCYVAGSIVRDITSDTLFSPVGAPKEEYCAAVTYEDGAQLFKSLDEAVSFAKKHDQTKIAVISDASISESIELANTELYIKGDVTVTIKSSGSLENNGTINVTEGGTIVNYGSFQNNKDGVMNLVEGDITGNFINNGSFMNFGQINDQTLITCKNHSWGDKIIVKEATYTEEGQYKLVCNACLKEKTGVIPRLDEEVTLDVSDEEVVIANGADKAVTAAVKPEGAIGKVTWTSDNEDVAIVTTGAEGNVGTQAVISGKSMGEAVITVEYKNDFDYSVKKTIKVTVEHGKDDPVDPEEDVTLKLSTESLALTSGSTSSVTATVEPEKHLGRVSWSSDNNSVAEVVTGADDNVGTKAVIIGKSAGSATITAEYRNDFGYSVKKTVKVAVEANKLEILYKGNKISDSTGKTGNIDLALADGANTDFTALQPDEATEISWSSSNESVMRVSCVDGVVTVTPVKTGTANIVATTEDKSATCAVRFVVPATGLSLNDAAITLDKGKSQQIGVNLTPSDSNERLTWESDNTNVAVVSGAGVVTAINEGTAKITVTTEGALGNSPKSESMTVTVKLVGPTPVPTYKKIASAKANSNKMYTGNPVIPTFTVIGEDEEVLVLEQDYTVSCTSNVRVGMATATIKGIGKYSGEVTCTFKVNPKNAVVKSITKGKKKMTVKMTTAPSSKMATTYQIAYKQKGTKTWKYATTSTASKTIKKLKKGKYYYVQVRSIKTISGEKYYGAWSKSKLSPKIK